MLVALLVCRLPSELWRVICFWSHMFVAMLHVYYDCATIAKRFQQSLRYLGDINSIETIVNY